MYLFQLWFPQGVCPVVRLLGQMVVLFPVFCCVFFFFFKESPCCSPQWLYQFTFPTTGQECPLLSTHYPPFIVGRLSDDGHSDWHDMIRYCSFDLHFSNNEQCWTSFHVFVGCLYVFFGEMSVLGLLPIFFIFCLLFFFFSLLIGAGPGGLTQGWARRRAGDFWTLVPSWL